MLTNPICPKCNNKLQKFTTLTHVQRCAKCNSTIWRDGYIGYELKNYSVYIWKNKTNILNKLTKCQIHQIDGSNLYLTDQYVQKLLTLL